jgi:hypothetical protein
MTVKSAFETAAGTGFEFISCERFDSGRRLDIGYRDRNGKHKAVGVRLDGHSDEEGAAEAGRAVRA